MAEAKVPVHAEPKPMAASPGAARTTLSEAEPLKKAVSTKSVPPPASEEAQPANPEVATGGSPTDTTLTFSRGLHGWLAARNCSIAFTCYQSGHLFMVGRGPDSSISLNGQDFGRAMGIAVTGQRMFVASAYQIWRLENALGPSERANGYHDRLYVPRTSQTTGDIDVHEIGVDRSGRLVFVSTSFSCLATTSPVRGFTPIWKPDFISKLAAEDRCHLNGMAMEDGIVRYVTAVSRSDIVQGWQDRRHEGGVLIDVQANRIITDQLSMPHSPRIRQGAVWVLDSGRGYLVRVDPTTGARQNVAFCPGFMRGLTFINQFALVSLSLPRREGAFDGLQLGQEIKARDGEPWCGLMIIDTTTGDVVEWIRAKGVIAELFDVAVIPGAVAPMSVSPNSDSMRTLLSYEAELGPLNPPKT